MVNTSIVDGYWYGVYNYTSVSRPGAAFRAQLVCGPDGRLTGSIADEINQDVPAVVDGTFDGRTLTFVKKYLGMVGALSSAVQYVGTVSPDGTMLSGTWSIRAKILFIFPANMDGTWQAQRYVPAY